MHGGKIMDKYEEYITNTLQMNYSKAYGHCKEVCEKMKELFPELTLVRGHYYDAHWGEREHWWFTSPNGNIVDPTKEQFPTKGKGVYIPWDESQPEPTGMCPNCGEYCYNGEDVHDHCRASFLASLYR